MIYTEPPPLPDVGVEIRPCHGWLGYAVTRDGRVYSCKLRNPAGAYGRWRVMRPRRPSPGKQGYLNVTICLGADRFQRSVHRLVLEAFVGQRPDGMECRHKDGNALNNSLDNICWDTPSENKRDTVRHGRSTFSRRGADANCAKFSDATIAEAKRQIAAGIPYREITAATGISAPYLSGLKKGQYRA